MFRSVFIFFLFITASLRGQSGKADSHTSLPTGQLLLLNKSEKPEEMNGSNNYMHNRFLFPDYFPLTISTKNIYSIKYVNQIDVFDNKGQLANVFEFSPKGELQSGKIITDHLIRWRHYRLAENVIVSLVAHYDKQGKLAKRDSVITTYYQLDPADTVVSYTSSSHWVYLSGAVVNERNNYYNAKYYKKRISIPAKHLNSQQERTSKAHIYLKKKLPDNYDESSMYLDRFFQKDENFTATVYNDTGKTEIYQQLPSAHYIKKRYHPLAKNTYGTIGADFNEPGLNADDEIDLTPLSHLSLKAPNKELPDQYKCTCTRRGLIDSVFVYSLNNRNPETPTSSFIYSLKYKYNYMAYFSGNEYEMEPQIILMEQISRYGNTYYLANFNKYFEMPSGKSIWLGDVKAFVKNRVKTIHIYYGKQKELQAFELDTAGTIIGGMEGSGNRRWKSYTDKNGNRFSCNEYYDGYGWLEKKDSSVYIPKIVKHLDTTFTFERMESYSYRKGMVINERNKSYNEEYLNKRVKASESVGSFGALNPNDPLGKIEGYIYLNVPLKTNYQNDQLYLCNKSTRDYTFKVTKDTTDITDSILINHRFRKLLVRPEIIKKLVSGEDFNPPYREHWGPACGGGGYGRSGYDEGSYDGTIFHSFSWTLNDKGLYDTCYKTPPIIRRYIREENDEESNGLPSKKAPQKYVLYTVRYEYY